MVFIMKEKIHNYTNNTSKMNIICDLMGKNQIILSISHKNKK